MEYGADPRVVLERGDVRLHSSKEHVQCMGAGGERGVARLSPGFPVLPRWKKVETMLKWEEVGHFCCWCVKLDVLLILPSAHIK